MWQVQAGWHPQRQLHAFAVAQRDKAWVEAPDLAATLSKGAFAALE